MLAIQLLQSTSCCITAPTDHAKLLRCVWREVGYVLQHPAHYLNAFVRNGSADDSLAICQRFAAFHPDRIRSLTHPGGANQGQYATRVCGAGVAKADLIAARTPAHGVA